MYGNICSEKLVSYGYIALFFTFNSSIISQNLTHDLNNINVRGFEISRKAIVI